ncbi:hypothetical protein HDU76_010256, partial [Blyttiomyces sp. JEL0837]
GAAEDPVMFGCHLGIEGGVEEDGDLSLIKVETGEGLIEVLEDSTRHASGSDQLVMFADIDQVALLLDDPSLVEVWDWPVEESATVDHELTTDVEMEHCIAEATEEELDVDGSNQVFNGPEEIEAVLNVETVISDIAVLETAVSPCIASALMAPEDSNSAYSSSNATTESATKHTNDSEVTAPRKVARKIGKKVNAKNKTVDESSASAISNEVAILSPEPNPTEGNASETPQLETQNASSTGSTGSIVVLEAKDMGIPEKEIDSVVETTVTNDQPEAAEEMTIAKPAKKGKRGRKAAVVEESLQDSEMQPPVSLEKSTSAISQAISEGSSSVAIGRRTRGRKVDDIDQESLPADPIVTITKTASNVSAESSSAPSKVTRGRRGKAVVTEEAAEVAIELEKSASIVSEETVAVPSKVKGRPGRKRANVVSLDVEVAARDSAEVEGSVANGDGDDKSEQVNAVDRDEALDSTSIIMRTTRAKRGRAVLQDDSLSKPIDNDESKLAAEQDHIFEDKAVAENVTLGTTKTRKGRKKMDHTTQAPTQDTEATNSVPTVPAEVEEIHEVAAAL